MIISYPRTTMTGDMGAAKCLLGNVNGKVDQTVGVSKLVVIPRDDLVEVVIEVDAGISINNRASLVTDKILGDDIFVGVAQNSLEFTFRSLLECGLDFSTCAGLFCSNGQVDQRHIGCGDSDGHTSKLAIELRNDLANGLGGSCAGRNQVVQGTASSTPVLSTLGGTIDNQLVGGSGVDGRHETFYDAKLVVQDLGKWGQAVGGA